MAGVVFETQEEICSKLNSTDLKHGVNLSSVHVLLYAHLGEDGARLLKVLTALLGTRMRKVVVDDSDANVIAPRGAWSSCVCMSTSVELGGQGDQVDIM